MRWDILGGDLALKRRDSARNELEPEDALGFVVTTFSSLESELMEFLTFIPLLPENLSVSSPRLAPLLLDSCSLIDSVFRHTLGDDAARGLKAYASEDRLSLHEAATLLLSQPIQLLTPFLEWRSQAPRWWEAYNRLKHDRVKHYGAATLENTVLALAGLHQVLVRSKDFLQHVAAAGWFVEQNEASMADLHAMPYTGVGSPPDLVAESRLFASSTRDSLVDWESDPPQIRLHEWDFSDRAKLLLFERWDRN